MKITITVHEAIDHLQGAMIEAALRVAPGATVTTLTASGSSFGTEAVEIFVKEEVDGEISYPVVQNIKAAVTERGELELLRSEWSGRSSLEILNGSKPLERAVLEWLAKDEGGVSSKTLAFRALGLKRGGGFGESHPHDPADFRRCVALLQEVPALRDHMDKVAVLSPEWFGLVKHWAAIEAKLAEEMAAGTRAPRTWEMMKEAMRR